MTDITNALPCPFCGGKCDPAGWLRVSPGDTAEDGPQCEDCGATADSIAAWNRRVSNPSVQPEPWRTALHGVIESLNSGIDRFTTITYQRGCNVAFMRAISEIREVLDGTSPGMNTTNPGAASTERAGELEPVEGDQLPRVGTKVLIHLASRDEWVEHTVEGYYVWGALSCQVKDGEKNAHRVFVRVRDADGYLNARLLSEVRTTGTGAEKL